MYYISKIHLENIRCFKKLDLDLSKDLNPIYWTTILGDNATGKSTLFKCIAIGLCDITSAAGLLREVPWNFRRKGSKRYGLIKIELIKNKKLCFTISTFIKVKKGGKIETISRKIVDHIKNREIKDDSFPWGNIFLCGYGSCRGLEGTVDYLKYSVVDAVYTLFRYDQPFQNPELAMRRLIQKVSKKKGQRAEKITLDWLRKQLKPLLLLDSKSEELSLEPDGIWLSSDKWGKVPLIATGDGYKSTLIWVMDFISWATHYWSDVINKNISGIILLDEVEQHLHPKWQRQIVSRLKNTFKNVQFITTTHSPLVASSVGRYTESNDEELFLLELKEDNVVEAIRLNTLRGVDLDQIVASKAFDYVNMADPEVDKLLSEASKLADKGRRRTVAEDKRYKKFKDVLKEILRAKGRSSVENEVNDELFEEMQRNIKRLERKLFN